MSKLSVFSCFFLLVVALKDACGKGLPTDIEKCHMRDMQCFLQRINYVFEKHPNGYSELLVPDLSDFLIGSFDVKQDSGKAVNLNLKIQDFKFTDFHNLRFHKIDGFENDWNNTVFTIEGKGPKLTAKSKYSIQGKILILPIEGSGDLNAVLLNPKITIKLKARVEKKENGQSYLRIDKAKIKTEPEKLTIHLDNLFNGDKTLGDNINKVMNENALTLWDDLGPGFDSNVAIKVREVVDNYLKAHPLEDIFLAPK